MFPPPRRNQNAISTTGISSKIDIRSSSSTFLGESGEIESTASVVAYFRCTRSFYALSIVAPPPEINVAHGARTSSRELSSMRFLVAKPRTAESRVDI